MKSARDYLNEEHTKVVRGAFAYARARDMDNYFLFYGRAQGLELAMDIIGVEFTPIHKQLP